MGMWKYLEAGQTCGPVETVALQALINNGLVKRDSLVLKDGATEWVPASSQPEFTFPTGDSSRPPLSSATFNSPPLGGATPSDAEDIEKNKVYAVLAYFGPLFLVPLLAAPNSKFARFHANQGIVLFLSIVVGEIGSWILMMVPLVGCLAAFFPLLILAAAFIFMIMGMVGAASGEYKPLPVIGQWKILT